MPHYEPHAFSQPHLPLLFHRGCIHGGYPVPPHWQEDLELLYVLEGEATLMVDGIPHALAPGNLAVISANRLHGVASGSPEFRYYCLIPDRKFCRAAGLPSSASALTVVGDGCQVQPLFRELEGILSTQAPCYSQEAQAVLLRLLVWVFRNRRASVPEVANEGHLAVVRAAMDYIVAHLDLPAGLDALCQAVGYSKYYLCHAFKEATGMTVVEYWNRRRCMAGMELMQGGMSVGEAAKALGFGSAAYFSRVYKQTMGTAPSADRRKELPVS